MAVYNGEPYIKETVLSILNQSFGDFEFIIVDDSSTDDTANVVTSFKDPRIILIKNEVNMGSARAGNVGIDKARSKYIARIDADDLSDPERFQRQYDYLEIHTDIAVLGSSFKILGKDTIKKLAKKPEEIAIKLFLGQNCIAHSSVMMRKDVFDKYGFHYNPDNPVSQDYELWVDVSNQLKIANLQEPLMEYRVHDNQISNKRFNEQQEHAIRIVTHQLKNFMPDVQINEVDAHLALTGFKPMTSIDLAEVVDWAKNIKHLNKGYGRFDRPLFDGYIDKLVSKRKRDYFNQTYFLSKRYRPALAAAYFRDIKVYQFKAKNFTVIKFIIKCFLLRSAK